MNLQLIYFWNRFHLPLKIMSESLSIKLEKKLRELEELKKKVEKLYTLNDIGGEISKEVQEEIKKDKELYQYKKLLENNVEISYLDAKLGKRVFRISGFDKKKSITKEEIENAYSKSSSAKQASRRLGVSYATFKRRAKMFGVFKTPGVENKKTRTEKPPVSPYKGKAPINEIIAGKHPYVAPHIIKDKLIRSEIKECKCENCGFNERRFTDGKIPLLLNFEDGDPTNHKIENLVILCYNCTFTCGKGYISRGPRNLDTFDPDLMQGSKQIEKQKF